MAEQRILDFGRIDVLAARHDHVLDTVMDVEKPVLVEIARIARMKEAAAQGFLGRFLAVPVALHYEVCADHDFANLALGHRIVIRIDDADDGGRIRQAARAQFAPARVMRFRRQIGAKTHRFGKAVELCELRTEQVHGPLQQVFCNRRGAIGNCLEGREIAVIYPRHLAQHQDDGRHPEGMIDLMLFDQFEDFGRVDLAQDQRHRTLRARQNAEIAACDVEERHGIHHHIALIIGRPVELGRFDKESTVILVGQHHALRQARGAGGVELDDIVIIQRLETRRLAALAGEPFLIGRPVLVAAINRDDRLQLRTFRRDLLHRLVKFLCNEQHL